VSRCFFSRRPLSSFFSVLPSAIQSDLLFFFFFLLLSGFGQSNLLRGFSPLASPKPLTPCVSRWRAEDLSLQPSVESKKFDNAFFSHPWAERRRSLIGIGSFLLPSALSTLATGSDFQPGLVFALICFPLILSHLTFTPIKWLPCPLCFLPSAF